MDAKNNRIIINLTALLLTFFAIILFQYSINREIKPEIIAKEFNENLKLQANLLSDLALDYTEVLSTSSDDYWPVLESIEEDNSAFVFIYQNSELLFWNTTTIFFNDVPKKSTAFLINNSNSWYLAKYNNTKQFEILLVKPIVVNYNVENQYINKYVNTEFSECNDLEIVEVVDDNCYPIEFFNSKSYYLHINSTVVTGSSLAQSPFVLLILYLLLVIFIIQLLRALLFKWTSTINTYLVSIGLIFIFRFVEWYFGLSEDIINSNLFRQQLLSVPLLSSLWDILLTSSIIFIFTIYFYKYKISLIRIFDSNYRVIYQLFYFLFLVLLPFFVIELATKILIIIGFTEPYFLFNNYISFSLLLIFALLGFVLYILFRSTSIAIKSKRINIISILLALLFSIVIVYFYNASNFYVLFISLLLVVFAFAVEFVVVNWKQFIFIHHLIYIIIISALFSFIVNKSVKLNKNDKQKDISSFLSQVGNEEVENLWNDFQKKITSDNNLNTLLHSYNKDNEKIANYLDKTYFTKIAKDIDIQITVCSNEEMLSLENEEVLVNCYEFFQDMKSISIGPINSNLYLISNEPDNIYYLGELQLLSSLNVYIEFYSFYVPSGLGYAELLVDEKKDVPDLSQFSFAKYHQDILISKFGTYEYHTNARIFDSFADSVFFELSGFKHYKTISMNGDILIVSQIKEVLSAKMISFSVFVLLFTVFFLLMTFFLYGNKFILLLQLNFGARLQLFFMIALVFTLFSTALIIMYYADQNRKTVLETQLNEKAHSVLIELQHKLSDYSTIDDVDKYQLGQLLQKFSMVFFSDINIYDTKGKIVASSRPQIFADGLLSEMVNPKAFEEIFVDNLLYYNCTEKIGNLEYFSSYLPLILSADHAVGIINLPYFARQKEQRRSFKLLLFTFVNLFVILGIIGTIIAFYYSRLLTKPLTKLQQNIASLRIDTHNEKIEWQSNDEIGQLIGEYNKMVDKLEASADILKRSEREIAWREVARQIAHEIKNPLTPMKLNIQYLEKSYLEKDSEFGTKIKDISQTLIQQIETLDKVAETFSDMAKSNIRNFKQLNLLTILQSVVSLFEKFRNIEFVISTENNQSFITNGVEKDLTQVFNNLLKNSVEAIGNKENGKVKITLSSGDSFHTLNISDNGSGIPESKMDIIFTPYFTTRTQGTGLGLAIVKTIITDMGGNIKLMSTSVKGTTFAIKFLKTDKDE